MESSLTSEILTSEYQWHFEIASKLNNEMGTKEEDIFPSLIFIPFLGLEK